MRAACTVQGTVQSFAMLSWTAHLVQWVEGHCVLTQHQEGVKDLCAASAVVACMLSQRLLSA